MNPSKISHLTKQLISCTTLPTNQSEIGRALDIMNQNLKSSGIKTRRFENQGVQLLWATNHTFKHPNLLLLCHIDVVSGEKNQFIPQIQGDKLIGRGAFDMKGPLATMISVITSSTTTKNLHLLVTSDEEIGGNHGAAWFFRHTKLKPKIALVPDGLEENTVILKQKGPTHLTLSTPGKSCHASRPWRGSNPVLKFSRILERINSLEKQATNNRQWRPTFTPTQITNQTSINQVSDQVTFTLDIRTTNQQQISQIKRIIKEEGGQIKKQFGDGKIFIQPKNHIIRHWMDLTRSVSQSPTKTSFSSSGSDARHIPTKTTTIITQAKGGNAHGQDEWVSITSLQHLFTITSKFIQTV